MNDLSGDVGPSADTAAGDVVVINVNPDGPYGVITKPFQDGCAVVVDSFERLPNGNNTFWKYLSLLVCVNIIL